MDAIDRFAEIIKNFGVSDQISERIAGAIRNEFAGEVIYMPKRSRLKKDSMLKDLKSGRHYKQVAAKHQISNRTALRALHKMRKNLCHNSREK